MQGKVMTVLGPIEPETLGITLTHEHLLVDLRVWCEEPEEEEQKVFVKAPVEMPTLGAIRREPFGNLDNCVLDDTALAIEELQKFKKAGGSSVVDCTNTGLGRTPLALKEVAQDAEVNIIMGSGYYIGRSHPYDMADRSVEMIADEIEHDLM
jgi:phosphotriesterase-related protein